MVNKLSVQVLYGSLYFAFVLGIGWMGEMRFNTMYSAPPFPFLLELMAMVRQYCLWQCLLLFQYSSHFLCSRFVVKLFSYNEEPAVIVDAYEEPVFLAVHCEWTFEVDLPQFIRFLGSEEPPPFMFTWISIYPMSRKNVVYGLSG